VLEVKEAEVVEEAELARIPDSVEQVGLEELDIWSLLLGKLKTNIEYENSRIHISR
jgi:hypothetical protein